MQEKAPTDSLCLIGGRAFTPDRVIDNACVVVEAGLITRIGAITEITVPPGIAIVNVAGLRIVPGLIDLHVHGMNGQDVFDGDLDVTSETLARHGITTFLATLAPASHIELISAIERLADRAEAAEQYRGAMGARLIGIYLEGPYISPQRPGVLDPRSFRPPNRTEAAELLRAGRGKIRVITIAPELDGALDLITWLSSQGVIASVGHSQASYERVIEAVQHGLRHATHTFNAMTHWHHRQPGVLGAVLGRDEITAEIIADRQHVHPAAIELLLRLKGVERTCLVSDAAPLAGLPPGTYSWLGQQVTIDDASARLDDGTLAGSLTTVNQALRNLIEATGLPFATALETATSTPARVLSLNSGTIAVGQDADIVALDDRFECHLTIARGQVVYRDI